MCRFLNTLRVFRSALSARPGRDHSPHGRGDEIRLRPTAAHISAIRTSSPCPSPRAHLEGLRRTSAWPDRSQPCAAAVEIQPGDLHAVRKSGHHPFLDRGRRRQCGRQYLHPRISAMAPALVGRRHGICSTTSSTTSGQARRAERYGLIGGDAKCGRPNKSAASSMSPTIVLRQGKTIPGDRAARAASRIITTVLQIIMNVDRPRHEHRRGNLRPRIHHQWLPDELRIKEGLSPDTIRLLEQIGGKVTVQDAMGSTQSIMVTAAGLFGSSDPRTPARSRSDTETGRLRSPLNRPSRCASRARPARFIARRLDRCLP